MADLAALIERLEKLTGSDREVDADIFCALNDGWRADKRCPGQVLGTTHRWLKGAPVYTASLDAVIALVERELPGWRIEMRIGEWPPHYPGGVVLWNNDTKAKTSVFGIAAKGATPAIALMIALLRSKPNVPDNVPEKENIANRWSLSINYGPDGEDGWANLTSPEGDHVANIRTHHAKTIVAGLNRAGDVAPPVSSWVGWRSINTAPEDQHVILCTSGGHVGEAIMLVDEDTGQQKWAWALGPLHPNHIPYGWQALPEALNAPAASDLRPGGFDGPTGAE